MSRRVRISPEGQLAIGALVTIAALVLLGYGLWLVHG